MNDVIEDMEDRLSRPSKRPKNKSAHQGKTNQLIFDMLGPTSLGQHPARGMSWTKGRS